MRFLKKTGGRTLHDIKVRQSLKIRCLSEALVVAGFVKLDDQAKVLGLPRSTAWTIFRSTHKGSGLSAATINRMLRSPTLPMAVREKIIEYVKEKTAGLYGHNKAQLRKFYAQIASDALRDSQMQKGCRLEYACDDDQGNSDQQARRRNS